MVNSDEMGAGRPSSEHADVSENEGEMRGKRTRAGRNDLASHLHLLMDGSAGPPPQPTLNTDHDDPQPHNATTPDQSHEETHLHTVPVIKEEGEVLLDQVNGQIELLDQPPEAMTGSNESGLQMAEDGQEWLPEGDHELKRVKVRFGDFPPSQCVDHAREAICAAHVPHPCVETLNFHHDRFMNS